MAEFLVVGEGNQMNVSVTKKGLAEVINTAIRKSTVYDVSGLHLMVVEYERKLR